MNIYFISGLGADRKAFERLQLPSHFTIHYLDWIKPFKNESLNEYAKRLASSIDIASPFSIVGLSMGGMIASVMTTFLQPYKTVLISSLGSTQEFPLLFKIARTTKIYKLIPVFILRWSNPVVYWMFGAKTREEKEVMDHLISHSDPYFIKWAIGAILTWTNTKRPQHLFHIHGSADKILPVKYTCPDIVIDGGSHFMVWTKAGEVSKILAEALR